MDTIEERFWAKVDKSADCWVWTGGKNGKGYAYINVDGKSLRATRVLFDILGTPIPDGLFACHHCDNRACVRPDHIFFGTHRENMADMRTKGRAYSGPKTPEQRAKIAASNRATKAAHPQARKTHCPRGHAYTGKLDAGSQRCWICTNDRQRERRWTPRGLPVPPRYDGPAPTCQAGHPRTPENVYVWHGNLCCRPCRAAKARAWRAARR